MKAKLCSVFILAILMLALAACNRDGGASAALDSSRNWAAGGAAESAPPAATAATPAPSAPWALTDLSPPIPPPPTGDGARDDFAEFAVVEAEAASGFDWPEIEARTMGVADRMVIRNADIAMDTLYFELTVDAIESAVATHGGFIESSSRRLSTRHGFEGQFWYSNFVIRVPVARFDAANRDFTALGQVTRFTTSSEDVTMLFQDLESRLNIREEEQRRVEIMLENATELRDIINLEAQLSELRITIDAYRRRMTEIDQLASFSTIRVTVREVKELIEEEEEEYDPYYGIDPYYYEDGGFFARMGGAFGSSVNFTMLVLENIAVFVAAVLLPIAIIAVPAFGLFLLIRRLYRSIQRRHVSP